MVSRNVFVFVVIVVKTILYWPNTGIGGTSIHVSQKGLKEKSFSVLRSKSDDVIQKYGQIASNFNEVKSFTTPTLNDGDTVTAEIPSDLTIVNTADGFLHAIDNEQKKIWTADLGGPMISGHQDPISVEGTSILPGIDGSTLVATMGGMRKTSVTARMLFEKTPFQTPDGLIVNGVKSTQVFSVNLADGRTVNLAETRAIGIDPLDHFSNRVEMPSNRKTILLGKTDYVIRAYDGSGYERFNMSYSELTPLTQKPRLPLVSAPASSRVRSGSILGSDAESTRHQSNQQRTSSASISPPPSFPLISTPDGELYFSNGEPLNLPLHLDSPVMQAFSVRPDLELDVRSIQIRYKMPNLDSQYSSANPSERSIAVVRNINDGGLYAIELSGASLIGNKVLSRHDPSDSTLALPSPHELGDVDHVPSIDYYPDPHESIADDVLGVNRHTSIPVADYLTWCRGVTYSMKNEEYLEMFHQDICFDVLPKTTLHPLVNGGNDQGDYNPFYFEDVVVDPKPETINVIPLPKTIYYRLSTLIDKVEKFFRLVFLFIAMVIGAMLVLLNSGFKNELINQLIASILVTFRFSANFPSKINSSESIKKSVDTDDGNSKVNVPIAEAPLEYVINEEGKQCLKVGSLIVSDSLLGYGSHGTVVYRGSLNGRQVAVKRMLSQFNSSADREIALLIRSDGHPNVVRYFLREQKGEFVYLALQLCVMSLRDFVSKLVSAQESKRIRQLVASGNNRPTFADALSSHSVNSRRRVQTIDLEVGSISDSVRLALLQVAEGLAHLHGKRILHRDIKPHNILLALPDASSSTFHGDIESLDDIGRYVLKISDMGLSKQLDKDGSSFNSFSFSNASVGGLQSSSASSKSSSLASAANPVGTIGWQAPELMAMRQNNSVLLFPQSGNSDSDTPSLDKSSHQAKIHRRRTQTVDIFSLGCVFHFVLVSGVHPFGEWFEREANIMNSKLDLNHFKNLPDAQDLMFRMLDYEPDRRPTAMQVSKHPFFWTSQQRLDFLMTLSDRLEHEQPTSRIVISLESNATKVVGRSWDRRLHSSLLEDMGKYRKYDTSSVRDCLRVIRNKRHHFLELSHEIKSLLSPMPRGFLLYFESRFPNLFMHCVKIACKFLANEKDFGHMCSTISVMYSEVDNDESHVSDHSLHANATGIHEIIKIEGRGLPSTHQAQIHDQLARRSFQDSALSKDCYEGMSSSSAKPNPSEFERDKEVTTLSKTPKGFPTDIKDITVWSGTSLANQFRIRGWWREQSVWASKTSSVSGRPRPRPTHIVRSAQDPKYRSRLCTHWEFTGGASCPMRKKGKCIFAHGPLELRVKESRRDKWGIRTGSLETDGAQCSSSSDIMGSVLKISGGEDVLSAARSIEKIRVAEGSVSEYEKSAKKTSNFRGSSTGPSDGLEICTPNKKGHRTDQVLTPSK